MTLFQPFRQSPDATGFDRDEKMFNEMNEFAEWSPNLREVPRLEKKPLAKLKDMRHDQARQSAESAKVRCDGQIVI